LLGHGPNLQFTTKFLNLMAVPAWPWLANFTLSTSRDFTLSKPRLVKITKKI